MYTKTRAMGVLAGGTLLASITGAVGSPAQAAPGNALNIPWVTRTIGGVSVLPQQIKAGDCHLQGLTETGAPTRAWIELTPANSNPPGYWINWDYSMSTGHFYNKFPFPSGDIWHATFVFKDSSGAELFRWSADAPRMDRAQTIFTGEIEKLINISTDQFGRISMVDWYGDC
jgi:hypothetical protein